MANWANTARLGDPRNPAWQRENLVGISPVPGQSWQVYKPAAAAFEGLLKDLVAAGYAPHSSGGYNYRTIAGSSRLSQHAFGNAIDINAPQNPMLARGQPMVTNLPPNVGEMAKKYGLEWGGNWSRPDPMHFEWSGGGAVPAAAPQNYASRAPAGGAPASALAGMMAPGPTAAPQMFGDLIGQNQVATTAVGPMDFGNVAANLLNSAQERDRAKAEVDAAETARRVALFGGADGSGLWGLYA